MSLAAICLLLLFGGRAHATVPDLSKAIHIDVEKFTLSNGLTVLLHEDHSTPMVSYQQWFHVGSRDERPGHTGLAHFFEHMMFKGTKQFPASTFGATLNSKGADFNAFTTNDYTGYYINLPSSSLKLAMRIESDRMRNLVLDPKDINSEREVVKEELRMRYKNSPEGAISEALPALMYKKLHYRWPVGGSMKDLNAATIKDFRHFYQTYYSPNNAVVVVVGDFNSAQVKGWFQELYGSIAKETIDRPPLNQEPEQTRARTQRIVRNVANPIVTVAYPVPKVGSPDDYRLEMLSLILGSGESSRLYKKMVYTDQIATSVSAYVREQEGAGQFVISVDVKPGIPARVALGLIKTEVESVINMPISPKELEKAKNSVMMGFVSGLKTMSGLAQQLAFNEIMLGDYKRIFTDLPRYEKVTVEDMQNAGRKYLKTSRRNIVIVVPGGKG